LTSWARASLAAILIATAATPARGQTISGSVDRAQLLRNQPPTLRDQAPGGTTEEGVAPASPNDPDLGEQAILKRADRYQPFTVVVSAPITYTSNVALVRTGEKSDTLFSPSVLFGYTPRITRTLYANVSIAQQMFYYDRFHELDFGSFDARAGFIYNIPQAHNLVLRADYGYNRLTDDDFDEFFASHSLNLAAEMPFRIGRAQQISVGLDSSFNLDSDPEEPGRHEYSAFAAYTVAIARSFGINAVFRLAVRDYTDVDRVDVSEILALGATYRFTQWLAVSAVATYANNNSDRDVFDYDVANGGGAVSVNFRF
jgi:hypothetical protein